MGEFATNYLLVLFGLLWLALVYVIAKFTKLGLRSTKAKSIIPASIYLFGASLLATEAWHYIDFRSFCQVNSGFVQLRPVSTEDVVYQGFEFETFTILLHPQIKRVSYEEYEQNPYLWRGENGRLRFVRTEQKSTQFCQFKHVSNFWLPSHLIVQLNDQGVCLKDFAPSMQNRFRIVRQDNWIDFINNKWIEPNRVDYSYSLIDNFSGETLSKFQSASTNTGVLVKLFFFAPWMESVFLPD